MIPLAVLSSASIQDERVVDGPSLASSIWLSYLDSFSDQKRKPMDPDRCAGGRGTGQKGRKVAGLPARRVSLVPIPKVSLYKIALYCRFIPDMSDCH
jgi:hypothetical protein